jgi:hypothetical protein
MMSAEDTSELGSGTEGAYGQDDAYAEAGEEAYPAEADSQQADSRTPWIVGGIVIAALVAVTCCLIVVAATLIGGGSGGGGQPVPTLPPLVLPTNTPAAPVDASPTPTPSDEPQPQPTPTTALGPDAVINAPAQATEGEQVTFDGSQSRPGTSPIASYDWDFGDGNRGRGEVVRTVYRSPGKYTVTLTITDQDGLTDTAPAQIEILSAATAEPTATPEPTGTPIPAPVVDDFEVVPAEIALGQCVKVSWSTSGGTTWVNVLRDDDYIWENAPLQGTLQDCPDKAGDHRYRVVAWNEVDDRVREDRMVTVTE